LIGMSRIRSVFLSNYKSAFFAYCFVFMALMSPFFLGQVIAPHRQYRELGASVAGATAGHIENRKFGDFSNAYIPEIWAHMHAARSGWLALWSGQNELGRPLYQISGLSPAYPPSWVIARLTGDPWRFITVLSLWTCFMAGLFFLLFCREISLSPLAGLVAGTSLAASPLFMYWLTFPMFPAVWCWASGALWAVTRLCRKPDLLGWSVLAFSGYSLLMTAYPQPVVFHAYILGGYGLYLACRKYQQGPLEAGRFLALSASALFVGGALALPVYIDLAHISAESARVAPDPSFFTVILPRLDSLGTAVRLFVLTTAPELLGNPIGSAYPFSYDGLSVTPLVVFLTVVGLLTVFRKTWGWWLAICVLCLLGFVHPLYAFGVKYLGFNLSRSTPLGSIMLPLSIITAYGVDALGKRSRPWELARTVWVAVVSVMMVIAVGLVFGLAHGVEIRWAMVLAMLVLAGLLAAQVRATRPVLWILALGVVLVSISHPLMLRQDPSRIAKTSALVDKVRANLPDGSRFAVAAPGLAVLPPNLNAELGLPSIHSYNSLSSRRYHLLIEALGGKVVTYGRWNGAISPDYNSAMFWMSNIGLMLSPTELHQRNLKDLGEVSGVHLYGVVSRMGPALQVFLPQAEEGRDELQIADPRLLPRHAPSKLRDQGDRLEFGVTPGQPSVLILSQKYYRDWQAQVFTQSGWAPAKTTVVNGVFQGVLLASGAQRVRLEFRPYARYAWIAHVFWLLLAALLGFRVWWNRRHAGADGVLAG
jgi:hypothetical protein